MPLYRVPVSALDDHPDHVAEARDIVAIPVPVAQAIKAMLKQRGAFRLTIPIADVRQHPESAVTEVYVRLDAELHTIELGVYAPKVEVRQLVSLARLEREEFERALRTRHLVVVHAQGDDHAEAVR